MTHKELRQIEAEGLHLLSDDEKLQLFIDGDYDTLIKAHMLYFWKLALRFAWNDEDLAQDYLSIILEGAARGLTRFNPERTPYISSYICNSGRNKMIEHLTHMKMQKRDGINISYDIEKDERYEINLFEIEDRDKEISNILDELFTHLKPSDLKIMQLTREGLSQREIAHIEGCSHQNINIKIKRIYEQLQSHL